MVLPASILLCVVLRFYIGPFGLTSDRVDNHKGTMTSL